MLFRRRSPLPFWRRLGNGLWPRQGLKRTLHYYRHRIFRLPGTPHSIAAGVASGVAMSFMPVGLHVVLAVLLAILTRGSILASTLATILIGNPIVVGFLLAADLGIGELIVGRDRRALYGDHISILDFFQHPIETVHHFGVPFMIGAIVLAIIAWFASYLTMRRLVTFAHQRRARRLRRTAEAREQGDML